MLQIFYCFLCSAKKQTNNKKKFHTMLISPVLQSCFVSAVGMRQSLHCEVLSPDLSAFLELLYLMWVLLWVSSVQQRFRC